jgi:hypothetical protein
MEHQSGFYFYGRAKIAGRADDRHQQTTGHYQQTPPPGGPLMLTSCDDLRRLRWYALEWTTARLRDNFDYLGTVWDAAIAAGLGDELPTEIGLIGAQYRGQPELAVWCELAWLDAAGWGGL